MEQYEKRGILAVNDNNIDNSLNGYGLPYSNGGSEKCFAIKKGIGAVLKI